MTGERLAAKGKNFVSDPVRQTQDGISSPAMFYH
jgi:hypothetical protein